MQVLSVQNAVGDELRQVHHDRRVRPDGVRGDDVDVGIQGCICCGGAAVQPEFLPGETCEELLAVRGAAAAGKPGKLSRAIGPGESALHMHRGHDVTSLWSGSFVLRLPLPPVMRCRLVASYSAIDSSMSCRVNADCSACAPS